MDKNCSLLKTMKWEMMLKASDDEYDSDATCCENSQKYETQNLNLPKMTESRLNQIPTPVSTSCFQGKQENPTREDCFDFNTSEQQNELVDSTNKDRRISQVTSKDLVKPTPSDKFERESDFGFTDLSVPVSANTGANHRYESDFNFTDIYEEEQACSFIQQNIAQPVYYFEPVDMTRNLERNSLAELTNLLPVEYFKAPLPVAGCLLNPSQLKPSGGLELNLPGHFNEKENIKPDENYAFNVNFPRSDFNVKPRQEIPDAINGSGGLNYSSDSGDEDLREVQQRVEHFLKESTENSQSGSIEGLPTIFNTVVNNKETDRCQIPGIFLDQANEDFLIGLTQNLNQIEECDPIKLLFERNSHSKVVKPCTPPLTLNLGVRRKVLPADKKLPSCKRKHLEEELKVLPARKCSSAFIDPSHRVENDKVVALEAPRRKHFSKGKTRQKLPAIEMTYHTEKKIKTLGQGPRTFWKKKKKSMNLRKEQIKREVFYPDKELQKVEEFLEEREGFMTLWLSGAEVDPPSRDQVFRWFTDCQLWVTKLEEFNKRIEKGYRFKNRKELMVKGTTLAERLSQLTTLVDNTITECDKAVEQETQDPKESSQETESSFECQHYNHSSSDASQTETSRSTNSNFKIKYGTQNSTLEVKKPILKVSSTESSNTEGNSLSKEKHITFSDEIEYKYLSGSDQSSLSLRENQVLKVVNHENVERAEKNSDCKNLEECISLKNSPPNEIRNYIFSSSKDSNKNSSEQMFEKLADETNSNSQCVLPLKKRFFQNSNFLGASLDFKNKTQCTTSSDVVSSKIDCSDENKIFIFNNKMIPQSMSQMNNIQESKETNTKYITTHPTGERCSDQQLFMQTPNHTMTKGIQTCAIGSEIHNEKWEENCKPHDFVGGSEELSIAFDKDCVSTTNTNHESIKTNKHVADENLEIKGVKDSRCMKNQIQTDFKCPKSKLSEDVCSHISWTPSSTSNTASIKDCNTSESTDAASLFTYNSIESQGDGFGFSEATQIVEEESLRETIMGIKSIRIKDPGEYMSVSEFDPDDFEDLDNWDD